MDRPDLPTLRRRVAHVRAHPDDRAAVTSLCDDVERLIAYVVEIEDEVSREREERCKPW